MISNPATVQDFQKWERQARNLSTDSIHYVIKDCRQAEQAMRGWNPEREGYYSDQAATFAQELIRRAK